MIIQPQFIMPGQAASEDWWLAGGISAADVLAAYKPKGAASLSESFVNLANPGTYDGTTTTEPTLTADGWYSDASTLQHVNTNIDAVYVKSCIIRFSGVSNQGYLLGASGVGEYFGISARRGNSGSAVRYMNRSEGTDVFDVSPAMSSGVLGMSQTKGFRNGSSEVSITTVKNTLASPVIILAYSNESGIAFPSDGTVVSAAFYGVSLTDAQMLAVSDEMAAL